MDNELFNFGIWIPLGVGFSIMIIHSLGQWIKNNAQPKVSNEVVVVKIGRRRSKSFRHGSFVINPAYDITFELANTERKKLSVPVYGNKWISEGDIGVLTSQGTRYTNFEKIDKPVVDFDDNN